MFNQLKTVSSGVAKQIKIHKIDVFLCASLVVVGVVGITVGTYASQTLVSKIKSTPLVESYNNQTLLEVAPQIIEVESAKVVQAEKESSQSEIDGPGSNRSLPKSKEREIEKMKQEKMFINPWFSSNGMVIGRTVNMDDQSYEEEMVEEVPPSDSIVNEDLSNLNAVNPVELPDRAVTGAGSEQETSSPLVQDVVMASSTIELKEEVTEGDSTSTDSELTDEGNGDDSNTVTPEILPI